MLKATTITILALVLMGQSRPPDLLSQARDHYNHARYDDAIRVAREARGVETLRDAASVIFARAHIERFRQSGAAGDLDQARGAMQQIDAAVLESRDRIELLIGLGALLYLDEGYGFDDRFSAAAEQFELALAQAELLDRESRDELFDWWAGSLDRQAQQGHESARKALYERILKRAEQELAHDSTAAAPSYWLAAAARGTNDLTRAIGAAVAGWVRASVLGERGDSLRLDLDRLMRQVILPERARELVPDGDAYPALWLLEKQWEQVRGKWEGEE
jgi:hypothetical protein